jgi:hypothetical protein
MAYKILSYIDRMIGTIGKTMKLLVKLLAALTILIVVGIQSNSVQTLAQGTRCDPSYPTVCIPPPPPDLDCKDISHRNFKVLPPDPHHFDGDHDGIGCET